MYMIECKNVVYFYRTEEHMISAVTGRGNMQKMYMAEYAVLMQEDRNWCKIVKDRSGMFQHHSIPFKKFVEIVKILMGD